MTVVVPNVPTPVPSRADPVNFAARADAYHEALPNVVDAMNLQNAENNSLNSSTAALKAQTDAVAASVALTANVTAWNAVAVYVVGNCVFDPVDFLTYRRRTAGSSAVRPGLDATNWMLLTGFGDVTLTGTQTLTNKTLSLGSNTLSGTLAQFNSALSDADFATLAGGETLTNKTLTSPSVSGVVVSDGTASTVPYLNGSKQLVSGSGLTFDGANLGVGTGSPAYKLDVNGQGRFGGANGVGYINFNSTTVNNIAAIGCAVTTGFGDSLGLAVQNATGAMTFATNSVERIRLDSSGNLGLGVTPSAWAAGIKAIDASLCGGFVGTSGGVNVISNAYYNGSNWIYKSSTYASYYEQNQANQGNHTWFTAPSGTAGQPVSFTQAMTLDASGNLLVGGTQDEGAKAVFGNRSSTGTVVRVQTSGNGTESFCGLVTDGAGGNALLVGTQGLASSFAGGAQAGVVFTTQAKPLIFGTSNTERARIDSSGNLLVGTAVNTVPVEQSYQWIAAAGAARFNHSTANNSGDQFAGFFYNATNIGSITQNGTTAVSYNTSSDYRLKNITGPITTSGAYIDSLNPVEGTWKADGSTFVGLIAHEVQEASRTQVATGEKDGEQMQAMDYSNSELIANLIAEVKSLRARVAALEIN